MEFLTWAWIGPILAWAGLGWLLAATLAGGLLIARDEWRHHRSRPEPQAVRAHAERLIAEHGREALRVNGRAMGQAQLAQDFDRCRFLRDVSGELASRAVPRQGS